MTVLRHVRAASCASLLVVALAGCGGNPEPEFSPAPAVSPTASASAEVDEPEAWQEKSDDGAVAFVEYWMALFREAENTGDTQALRDVSTNGCETCQAFAGEIEKVYSAGGVIESDGWRVMSAGTPTRSDGAIVVPIEVRQSPQRIVESAGAAEETNPGVDLGLAARLRWRGDAWAMDRLDIVQ